MPEETTPEQPITNEPPADTIAQAPQSVLDAAMTQAQEEKAEEEAELEEGKKFSLPKLSLDSLFDQHKRLKKRAKLLIAAYVIIVFGALIFQTYTYWKNENALQEKFDQRQAEYVDILANIDLADLSEGQRQ